MQHKADTRTPMKRKNIKASEAFEKWIRKRSFRSAGKIIHQTETRSTNLNNYVNNTKLIIQTQKYKLIIILINI